MILKISATALEKERKSTKNYGGFNGTKINSLALEMDT